jgi:hypothetical protein
LCLDFKDVNKLLLEPVKAPLRRNEKLAFGEQLLLTTEVTSLRQHLQDKFEVVDLVSGFLVPRGPGARRVTLVVLCPPHFPMIDLLNELR